MSAKNYLVAGFAETDVNDFGFMLTGVQHEVRKVRDTTLGDDRYANVTNAADVELDDDDDVYIDKFGRVNGFTHRGRYYVVAYS